jgi:GTPase SAR1 family protein
MPPTARKYNMALIKKIGGKSVIVEPGAAPVAISAKKTLLVLPQEQNVPPEEFSSYTVLLYGEKKLGKTSLCSHFPGALFIALEPGTKALKVFSQPANTYEELEAVIDALEVDTRFGTVVVDTIDMAYEMTFDYICRKQGIKHPNEEDDYGATFTRIKDTFKKLILRLITIPGKGILFISHDVEKEIETRDGSKIQRVQPTMAKGAMAIVDALVDVIINLYYEDGNRWLRIDGTQTCVAGCRLEENFVRKDGTPRTAGDRIRVIPMGRTSLEAYDNLMSAYNNEQVDPDPSEGPRRSSALKKAKAE